jgi:fructose-bisphosphate aldolase class 1
MKYEVYEEWLDGAAKVTIVESIDVVREIFKNKADLAAGYASLRVRLDIESTEPSLGIWSIISEQIEYAAVSVPIFSEIIQ